MGEVTFEILVETYLKIGILGLCAVILLLVFIMLTRKFIKELDIKNKRDKDNNNLITDGYSKKDDLIINNYADFLKQQREMNTYLIEQIVKQVTQHTTSPQETERVSEIQEGVNNTLQDMLIDTNASRVCVIQFHNGGRGINRQAFLKMSMTNEIVQSGIQQLMPQFKDQFRSMFPYFFRIVNEQGFYYLESIEEIKDKDAGLYEFLKMHGVQSGYYTAIYHKEGWILGMLNIEYVNSEYANLELVDGVIKKNKHTIETLLSL